ncbi:MAG: SIMPL domain-containing protein [Bacteroidetes bacterium]|nr:SIMPL domain-containing protein [Bacteroidota bacterium]
MKTLKTITILLLLTATTSVFAQPNKTDKIEQPFIEVTGTAENEIIPDEIYIEITLRERHEGKENITIDKQEADLKEALKSIGLDLDDLSLSDAIANYVRVKWRKKDVITKSEYVLKVNDALTVGKVFEKLDELKIEDANILRVDHSKIDSLRKEVRIMAIKAAKDKAIYLLTAIGEQIGKPLIVRESGALPFSNLALPRNVGISGYYSQGYDADKVIQFQKINLRSSIYVKFEIGSPRP